MKFLRRKIVICMVPVLLGLFVIGLALWNYTRPPLRLFGEPVFTGLKFNLGVDLVGGTILVYEIDPDKKPENYNKDQLVAALKRRLDPADLKSITIRPLSDTRIEIIIPTGGRLQAQLQQQQWDNLLAKIKGRWEADWEKANLEEIRRGETGELVSKVAAASGATPQDVSKFIEENYTVGERGLTGQDVQEIKELVQRVGSLEFRILANKTDDQAAINAARDFFKSAAESWEEFRKAVIAEYPGVAKPPEGDKEPAGGYAATIAEVPPGDLDEVKRLIAARSDATPSQIDQFVRDKFEPNRELERLIKLNIDGLPPPQPEGENGKTFTISLNDGEHAVTYSWTEIGKSELHDLMLNSEAREGGAWQAAQQARQQGAMLDQSRTYTRPETEKQARVPPAVGEQWGTVIYSRRILNPARLAEKDKGKQFEYFILTRNPPPGEAVTGEHLTRASEGTDQHQQMAVNFSLNATGANRFYDLTSANGPPAQSNEGTRFLAIVLDGYVSSAATINSPIRDSGQISGNFTKADVNQLITILRSGALPATLKPQPVSENTMGATLGDDTIRAGSISIVLAFLAVLAFMVFYYRFAGLVASVALLANLILTVAFMVIVSATFTLPGLAGLVLTVGMAVDANVLIYERLREERERGASLALAIRNGYDRAFPTIIDTHLTSIFTAIVLYVVGNDQLKGFGISLTVGLIISLFTALYMTRVMFDFFLVKGWLKQLRMLRLFARPNIDFMRVRYYWFTATVLLTVFGISVFLVRGKAGLNMDFVGGTVYSGELTKFTSITELRDKLGDEQRQEELLNLAEGYPKQTGENTWEIKYAKEKADAPPHTVQLAEKISREELARRAQQLPDVSLELIYHSEESLTQEGKSKLFTVRTTEKSSRLVQLAVSRLLGDLQKSPKLQSYTLSQATLTFSKPVTAEEVRPAIVEALKKEDVAAAEKVTLKGVEETRAKEGEDRFATLQLNLPTTEKGGRLVGVNGNKLTAALKSLTGEGDRKLASFQYSGADLHLSQFAFPAQVKSILDTQLKELLPSQQISVGPVVGAEEQEGRYQHLELRLPTPVNGAALDRKMAVFAKNLEDSPLPVRLENFDSQLAADTQNRALYAILASWAAILLYVWFRFGNWTFGLAAVLCLVHDVCFTLGIIAFCHYLYQYTPWLANALMLRDFKIDLPTVAALLTLVGYSINDKIVVYDRMREVRGRRMDLTPQMINDSINQSLSRTVLTGMSVLLVLLVLYVFGGEGIHLFSFVMLIGMIIGTYSSIYVASPLLLMFGEGTRPTAAPRERAPQPVRAES